jgi:hypothetical protein
LDFNALDDVIYHRLNHELRGGIEDQIRMFIRGKSAVKT